jgi:Zn-dependent protease with chaperone function
MVMEKINNTIYYCQLLINSIPNYLNIILPALALSLVAVLGIRILNFYFKSLFFKRKLGRLKISEDRKNKIVVVNSKEKFAFVLGIRNPKIYVSKSLISSLSRQELKAVLLHERYHLENRDTLIILIASLLNSTVFLFPALGDLIKNYKIKREIAADRFAVNKIGNNYALVSALSKILAAPRGPAYYVASIAEQDTLEYRILALVSKTKKRVNLKPQNILISFLSIIIIAVTLVVPVYAGRADKTVGFCKDMGVKKTYSEAPPAFTSAK